MPAFATSESEIPLRHNTSTRIFTTRGYVWPVKTLDKDYLATKQFGMFGLFCLCFNVFASNFIFTWVIPIACVCACACACVAIENQALPHVKSQFWEKMSGTSHWEISFPCTIQEFDVTTPYYTISACIICQMVAYERLKTLEIFKLLALKVVAAAHERWSPTRGSEYTIVIWLENFW